MDAWYKFVPRLLQVRQQIHTGDGRVALSLCHLYCLPVPLWDRQTVDVPNVLDIAC